MQDFRQLCSNKIVKHWKNLDDLGSQVVQTLIEQIKNDPKVGWVRADSVSSEKALKEITKLSEEKREMQQELESFRDANSLKIPAEVVHLIEEMRLCEIKNILQSEDTETKLALSNIDTNLFQLFMSTYKQLSLAKTSNKAWNLILSELKVGTIVETTYGIDLTKIFEELASKSLISELNVQVNRNEKLENRLHYKLTDYGADFASYGKRFIANMDKNDTSRTE